MPSIATPLATTVQAVTGAFDLIDAPDGVRAGDTLVAIISSDQDPAAIDITGGGTWVLQDQRDNARLYTQVCPPDNPTTYAIALHADAAGLVALAHLRGATPAGLILESGSGLGGPTVQLPATASGAAGGIELRYVMGIGLGAPTWLPAREYTREAQAGIGDTAVWVGVSTLLTNAAVAEEPITSTTGAFLWQVWTLVVLSGDYVPPEPPEPAFTPAKGSALYRITAHDFVTGEYRDDLYPQDGWTYDLRIGEPGAFSATLPIPNKRVAQAVRRVIPRFKADLTTGPGRIEIRIWRDGVLQPRYWLTGARLGMSRDGTISVQLRGSTRDAYFFSLRVREDLTYSGDQVASVRQLLQHALAQDGADMDLLFQAGSSGVTRPLTVKASDGTTYGRAAQEYARTSGGFEYMITDTVGETGVESTWRWGYPELGDGTKHVFTSSPHGGEVAEWGLDIDALRGGTDIQVRGGTPESDATQERQPLYSAMVTTPHRVAGAPRIDRLVDHPTQSVDQTTLDLYAAKVAATSGGALWVRTVTVFLGKHPTLTMQKLGDYARLVLTDVWHEREDGGAGLDESERVIGMQIRASGRGRGKDEATLILASLEVTT